MGMVRDLGIVRSRRPDLYKNTGMDGPDQEKLVHEIQPFHIDQTDWSVQSLDP